MTDKLITHEEVRDVLINETKMVWNKAVFTEDYISQQEQRDKDVSRYFELELKIVELQELTADEYTEYVDLYGKLTKGVAKWQLNYR